MVCPTCGLDNDPSAAVCARCNTTLGGPPPLVPSVPPYRRPPRNHHLPLIAALSAVVLIALVAVVLLRGGGTNRPVAAPAPVPTVPATTWVAPTTAATVEVAPDPVPQARVIDALLDRSVASRNKLNSAISRVGRCAGLSDALDDMRAVGDERRSQIAEAQDADLAALADGESIRSTLVTALQHSLAADEAYVEWAELAVSGGCATTQSRAAAYARGRSASDQAGAAKEAFLAVWNPVATQLGMPERSRKKI